MSTEVELSAEELALQETEAAVAAEAAAKAEATDEPKQGEEVSAESGIAPQEGDEVAPEKVAKTDEELAAEAEAREVEVQAPTKAAEAEAAKHDPTAAIVAFRKRNQELLANQLRLEGELKALRELATKPSAAEEVSAPVDPLEVISAQRISLAEQADNGDISFSEMRKQDLALEKQARDIEYQRLVASQPKAAAPESDLYLEKATAQLLVDYPILNELSEADIAPFEKLAYAQAAREGNPIQAGALGTLDLRTRMAQLATKMYSVPAAVTDGVKEGKSADQVKADALAAKVALQNDMPPNARDIGKGNTELGMTEAELTKRLNDPSLTYEESAKLLATVSPATRAKLGLD